MPTNNFVFNGISARDYGIDVLDVREEEATYRDAEGVPVPGRTGELFKDGKRYANVTRVYSCAITKNSLTYLKAFNAKLLSFVGNYRLEDTFDMDISHMMGRYLGAITPRISRSGDLITVEFSFDCAPQKYLESGQAAALSITTTGGIPAEKIRTGTATALFNSDLFEWFEAQLKATNTSIQWVAYNITGATRETLTHLMAWYPSDFDYSIIYEDPDEDFYEAYEHQVPLLFVSGSPFSGGTITGGITISATLDNDNYIRRQL